MPQKVLKFTGINRAISEFQTSGECEELINVRIDTNGSCTIVKPKSIIADEVRYIKLHEHSFGSTQNLIAITYNGEVVLVDKEGNGHSTITDEYMGKNIDVSLAGNVLVVFCKEENSQLVFKFENGTYTKYEFALPKIKARMYYYPDGAGLVRYSAIAEDDSVNAYNEALGKAASELYYYGPNRLCGASVIGCTYELEDGKEIWSTAFIVANYNRALYSRIPEIDTSTRKVTIFGATTKVYFDIEPTGSKNVKSIKVYASKPILTHEITSDKITGNKIAAPVSLDKLSNQVMYYQGSISPNKTSAVFDLNFGEDMVGEAIMDVTSGCVNRVGNIISYNNRFHYYDSQLVHTIQTPTSSRRILDALEVRYDTWVAYVYLNGEWKLINNLYSFGSTFSAPGNEYKDEKIDVIYPMAGVKKMAFVRAEKDADGNVRIIDEDMFYVSLSDSGAYNYSYAFDVTPTIGPTGIFLDDKQRWGNFDTEVFWKDESNAINVSDQYNPFVFPVEYSYAFSGEVLDIATSYLPISATQVGQYPLTVFTSVGIFALEQGSGSVLYGNIVPLQPLVIKGKSISTPVGTFFVSSKNLYLLSGRDAVDVSRPLMGKPESTPKALNTYKALCCSSANDLYDFTDALSQFNFESIISDVSLVYDQLQNELYISSNSESVKYSYVLNLATRLFHKVPFKFKGSRISSRYALRLTNQTDIVDLFEEYDTSYQPILLQSRPMALEVFYTHIQRIMMLIDTSVVDEQYLFLSVFGSNNLSDWECIISSQKRDVVLRQIRTNKAARSYKDYVILINGAVPTDTNISDIIADYTVVQRRLG